MSGSAPMNCHEFSAVTRRASTTEGNAVVVHGVIGDAAAGGGDETLDPRRSLLSERYDGTLAEFVAVPSRESGANAGGAQLRGGCVPADCLADRVSDAHRQLGNARPATRCWYRAPAAASRPR